MRTGCILLLALCGAAPLTDSRGRPSVPPIDHSKPSAIETRPIWDRPPTSPSLIEKTQAAVDRGNGVVSDPNLYELSRIDLQQAINAGLITSRENFLLTEADWDRQRTIERAEQKAQSDAQRKASFESESEALAGERERFIQRSLQPRHAEAAIVDKQMLDQASADYTTSITTAAAARDSAIASIDPKLNDTDKTALKSIAQSRYDQRVHEADLRRQQVRDLVLGKK